MKEYSFRGAKLRTEIILGSVVGILCLLIAGGVIYFYGHQFLGYRLYDMPVFLTIGAVCVGLLVAGAVLRLLGRQFDGLWRIRFDDSTLKIYYNKKLGVELQLNDIQRVTLNGIEGEKGFKYLVIYFSGKKTSIRVGNSTWMPFSTTEDINKFDDFLENFSNLLEKKNFAQKRTEKITGSVSNNWKK